MHNPPQSPLDLRALPTRIRRPSRYAQRAIATAIDSLAVSEPGLDEWYTRYVRDHRARLAVDFDLITLLDPDRRARLLDVGSTPPLLLAALAAEGRDVAGADLAPERFENARSVLGIHICQCDIETDRLPFPDRSFDIVVFNELFEHLRINPIHAFREVSRVLRPGGVVSLSTPNAASLRGLRNFLLHQRSGWCNDGIFAEYSKLMTIGHMGHVREYTLPEIRDFLSHFALEVQAVVWRGGGDRAEEWAAAIWHRLSPFMSLVAIHQTD